MSAEQPEVAIRQGPETPLLDVRNLCTWFPIRKGVLRRVVGHVRAVDGVSFSIAQGKTLALVGESGCGKTTVGRSILRLLEPNSGEVRYRGKDLLKLRGQELRAIRRELSMVFQDPMTSLNPRLRVRDIVAEGIEAFGISAQESEITDRVVQALLRVRLDPDHLYRFPHEFSGGQRQRIGLARALAVEPKLVILDEAVSALDVSIQAQMLNLLGELQAELNLTYLFITHDLSVVKYLSDDVCVMYLGQVVENAPAERLFERPLHPYTQGLLSAVPSANPDQRGVRAAVLGDVPSPAHPPSGCRFHTRCPKVFARCATEMPDLYSLDAGRSRCFLNQVPSGPPGRTEEAK